MKIYLQAFCGLKKLFSAFQNLQDPLITIMRLGYLWYAIRKAKSRHVPFDIAYNTLQLKSISMLIKRIQRYLKYTLMLLCVGACIGVLIHRGLHGEYSLGIHGVNISLLLLLPLFIVCIFQQSRGIFGKILLSKWILYLITLLLSMCLVVFYLSSNGLWCAQHPKIIKAMCKKLNQFAAFADSSNITSWWLTLGDLLAVQRGHDKPMFWEHDIDICITPEQYPIFLKALNSNPGLLYPAPEFQKTGHWYLPIDMEKLGLLSTTKRTAEGVNIDIWTCPGLTGNMTRVQYCNGLMNVPESKFERHSLLKELYGNYSQVKYAHHAWMCKIWTG